MLISTTETVEVEKVLDIICNKCGNSCQTEGMGGPQGLLEVHVSGGYGSKYLGDMNHYRFSLCECCLHEIFQTFKHPAFVRDQLELAYSAPL